MKKIKSLFISGAAMLLLPVMSVSAADGLAGGDESAAGLGDLIGGIVSFINAVLIPAILALAFLVFVWGVFKYFVAGGADDDAKAKGKSLMLYAIAGFVLILIFFGVVQLLAGSIGLEETGLVGTTPGIPLAP